MGNKSDETKASVLHTEINITAQKCSACRIYNQEIVVGEINSIFYLQIPTFPFSMIQNQNYSYPHTCPTKGVQLYSDN